MMPAFYRRLSIFCLMLITACAQADHHNVGVSDAWIRAGSPGQKVGAAYMTLQSQQTASLIKAESPVAGMIEIHTMTMENDVMKMRMLDNLPLPAGKPVALKPGGLHLMLFDLKQPLEAGLETELTLHFKGDDGRVFSQKITIPVKTRMQVESHDHDHHGHHHEH